MDNQTFDDVLGAFAEIDKIVKRLKSENAQLEEDKKNLIRADKKKSDHIDELEEEVKELKRCWSIEIKTCNRYREKCEKLEEELKHREEGDYGYDYFDED